MIPKTRFEELVKEVGESVEKGLRSQQNAILALLTANEDYLHEVMEKSASAVNHAKLLRSKAILSFMFLSF